MKCYNIRFVYTHHSARSILGKSLASTQPSDRFVGFLAETSPGTSVNPIASQMDFMVTVCDDAAGRQSPWPRPNVTAHWGFPDPLKVQGSEFEKKTAFVDAMNSLKMSRYFGLNDFGEIRFLEFKKYSCNSMKNIISEFIGTALLLAIVAGSGLMGESLGAGNDAVALLGNSIATGAGLYVLITLLGPISGAHFNPVVSAMFWQLGYIKTSQMLAYWLRQLTGAVIGIWVTHWMFSLPIMQVSSNIRTGSGMWVSEFISTLVLLVVIRLGDQGAKDKVPMLVALTVVAGYWFTSSTFFANPAVAIARSLTNTFVGIAPADVSGFIVAETLAAIIFIALFCRKVGRTKPNRSM
ncbi:aquaporin [Polynucleobacter brandtiae]|nr:aquaporin [Polynucleobacter brandtiae]